MRYLTKECRLVGLKLEGNILALHPLEETKGIQVFLDRSEAMHRLILADS